jgi:hypothetical protein
VFTVLDPVIAGWAVYNATIRFHDPAHAQEWSDSDIDTCVGYLDHPFKFPNSHFSRTY